MVVLAIAGLVILYFALRPGPLPGALYLGWGTLCLFTAAGELIARTRPNRSLLGFSSAWVVLVLALMVTGVGLVLLGLSWMPSVASVLVPAGLVTYLLWSMYELWRRRTEHTAGKLAQ